jgi:hypothetical protein
MPVKFETRDLGIDKLREDMAALKRQRVTFGWQGPSAQAPHPNADGASIGLVAFWQEYGTKNADQTERMPARPAVHHTTATKQAAIAALSRRGAQDIIDGRHTLDEVEARIGRELVTMLRESIIEASSWAKPLAASTVKAKGHDDPLIESGAMYDAASWAVREGETTVRQGGT